MASDSKPRVVVLDMDHAGQAAVVLAPPDSSARRRNIFAASSLLGLGGGYSSRLNQEIRIKRGLSYSGSSALDVRRGIGPFSPPRRPTTNRGYRRFALIDELAVV